MREVWDVLVVGSGIGGLCAAIAAAENGKHVLVLTKTQRVTESNTYYAQGGIVESGEGDSVELLEQDIIAAGDYLNFREAVHVVAEEGPRAVDEYLVEKAGIMFDRGQDGQFDRTREAAHSVRRILHVKDTTGKSIEAGLLDYARNMDLIHIQTGYVAVDLITNCHNSSEYQERYRDLRVLGAYVLVEATGLIEPLFARAVILATGGAGNVYQHTSNPVGATGDGIAMAHRAGCTILNAEYVQFHPTVLYHRDVKRFLISEAVRGEGARLMNRDGEYFMARYNSELKDLAPRDEVARAIFQEMDATGAGYVLLDASGMDRSFADRFPLIYEQCQSAGIDAPSEPIPVVPAAHYFCGGVKVDLLGKTSVPGLYAVGESSCTGVHGANRLASVSLLEALVFGLRAGRDAAKRTEGLSQILMDSIPDWIYPSHEEDFDSKLIMNDMQNVQATMWNYVGIIRTRKRLDRALSDLNYLSHRIQRFYEEARVTRDIIELRNMVLTGIVITQAAIANSQSLGCHYIS
ncbi:MAG TPA: L-aspartate oxidase [Spirochaetia bacterium]|nr:L-aspartate oxidase [Spirochaetia bacterium]